MVRLRSQLEVRGIDEGDDEINDCLQIRLTPNTDAKVKAKVRYAAICDS